MTVMEEDTVSVDVDSPHARKRRITILTVLIALFIFFAIVVIGLIISATKPKKPQPLKILSASHGLPTVGWNEKFHVKRVKLSNGRVHIRMAINDSVCTNNANGHPLFCAVSTTHQSPSLEYAFQATDNAVTLVLYTENDKSVTLRLDGSCEYKHTVLHLLFDYDAGKLRIVVLPQFGMFISSSCPTNQKQHYIYFCAQKHPISDNDQWASPMRATRAT